LLVHDGGDKVFALGWTPSDGKATVAGKLAALRWNTVTGNVSFEVDNTARAIGDAVSMSTTFSIPKTGGSLNNVLYTLGGGVSAWGSLYSLGALLRNPFISPSATYKAVTYDSNGLVTGGTTITPANIGAAPASAVSGATGYVAIFTSSTSVGTGPAMAHISPGTSYVVPLTVSGGKIDGSFLPINGTVGTLAMFSPNVSSLATGPEMSHLNNGNSYVVPLTISGGKIDKSFIPTTDIVRATENVNAYQMDTDTLGTWRDIAQSTVSVTAGDRILANGTISVYCYNEMYSGYAYIRLMVGGGRIGPEFTGAYVTNTDLLVPLAVTGSTGEVVTPGLYTVTLQLSGSLGTFCRVEADRGSITAIKIGH
jgi:hypothetical protein